MASTSTGARQLTEPRPGAFIYASIGHVMSTAIPQAFDLRVTKDCQEGSKIFRGIAGIRLMNA